MVVENLYSYANATVVLAACVERPVVVNMLHHASAGEARVVKGVPAAASNLVHSFLSFLTIRLPRFFLLHSVFRSRISFCGAACYFYCCASYATVLKSAGLHLTLHYSGLSGCILPLLLITNRFLYCIFNIVLCARSAAVGVPGCGI